MRKKFKKGDEVFFIVKPGEHHIMAHRPGVVVGFHRQGVVVECTEERTIFKGCKTITPLSNLQHAAAYRKANECPKT